MYLHRSSFLFFFHFPDPLFFSLLPANFWPLHSPTKAPNSPPVLLPTVNQLIATSFSPPLSSKRHYFLFLSLLCFLRKVLGVLEPPPCLLVTPTAQITACWSWSALVSDDHRVTSLSLAQSPQVRPNHPPVILNFVT